MTQVSEPDRTARSQPASAHRYDRESVEFGRVLNLSDGVFAIALTLLVLTLDSLDIVALVTFALASVPTPAPVPPCCRSSGCSPPSRCCPSP